MLTVADLTSSSAADVYPAGAALDLRLRYLCRYADCGPQLFGVRPYRIQVVPNGFEIHALDDVHLDLVDPQGRESMIAAGAAIYMLRLAMRCHLMDSHVAYRLSLAEPSLLATIEVAGEASPTSAELAHFSALMGERTPRPKSETSTAGPQIQWLAQECGGGKVSLRFTEDRALRSMTVSMLQAGDELFYSQAEDREAFRTWLGLRAFDAKTCRSDDSFLSWTAGRAEREEIAQATVAERDTLGMAVLSTAYDDERSWLDAGQVLAKAQLTASLAGMRLTVFNQPLQVPGMRARFAREAAFSAFPQVVVRFGYGIEGIEKEELAAG